MSRKKTEPKRPKSSALCRECGHRVKVQVPIGGDGSVLVYARHNKRHTLKPERCEGSRQVVPHELEPKL